MSRKGFYSLHTFGHWNTNIFIQLSTWHTFWPWDFDFGGPHQSLLVKGIILKKFSLLLAENLTSINNQCNICFFQERNCVLCLFFRIDGGDCNDGIARYINDSPRKYANCSPKPMPDMLQIHLYSTKCIKKGQELRYSYDMKDMVWRSSVRYQCFTGHHPHPYLRGDLRN